MQHWIIATLLVFSSAACARRNPNSAVQSIASTANQALITKIQSGEELKLSDVIRNKEKYGLSQKEIDSIRKNFDEADLDRLVLNYVDPLKLTGKKPARWAYIPPVSDDAVDMTKIEALDKDGRIDIIDGSSEAKEPDFPLITLSHSERLKPASTQARGTENLAENGNMADGALMINTISFSDVREPWIKGAAEVYAVISYVDKNGKAANEIVELPAIDSAGTTYDARQVVHFWKANRYKTVNISFFEHDSGYDYGQLTTMLVASASAVVTSTLQDSNAKTVAVTAVLAEITRKVVDSLPKGSTEDNDDFLDSIESIEKYEPGSRNGFSGNVKVEMSHHKAGFNDE